MKKSVFLLALATLLLLAACGFEPVYGTLGKNDTEATTTESNLAQVDISNIPDREGQYLRNALIDRFYQNGRPVNPKYTLSVAKINEGIRALDITKSADSTRAQLRLNTSIQLVDLETGDVVMARDLRAITSYNILSSEFSTRVSEQNTRENALDDLARQIEMQVSLFFNRDTKSFPEFDKSRKGY